MSTKSVKYCSRFYQGVQVDEDGQAHGPKIPLKTLFNISVEDKIGSCN